jgi:hypothetical protein
VICPAVAYLIAGLSVIWASSLTSPFPSPPSPLSLSPHSQTAIGRIPVPGDLPEGHVLRKRQCARGRLPVRAAREKEGGGMSKWPAG